MCFDADNIYIGETDGKNVHQLYYDYSLVPRKHDAGGQSQRRFERNRDIALLHWMKEISELTDKFRKGRNIYLGCNVIYKNQIKKYMSKETIDSIVFEKSVSIDDNCLWELIEVSRYEKDMPQLQ